MADDILPPFNIGDQRFLCVQVASYDAEADVHRALEQRCRASGLTMRIATWANDPRLYRWLGWSLFPDQWLARDAGISRSEAQRIIAGFPIKLAAKLNCLAMNPRRFLGVAAAICRHPDVVVFDTPGMDPMGFKRLHEYLFSMNSGPRMIHLSCGHECGHCEANASCLTVAANC